MSETFNDNLLRLWKPLETITSGIKELDSMLRGGFGGQELAMFAGSSGKGKSNLLINFTYSALLNGFNVLFISIELPELIINERINMRICRCTDEALMKNIDTPLPN